MTTPRPRLAIIAFLAVAIPLIAIAYPGGVEVGGVPIFPGLSVPTSSSICFDGSTRAVCITYNGTSLSISGNYVFTGSIQAPTITATTSLVAAQSATVRGQIANDASGANCTGSASAVCVNDVDGFAVANGSNTVGATITGAGVIGGTVVNATNTDSTHGLQLGGNTAWFASGAAVQAGPNIVQAAQFNSLTTDSTHGFQLGSSTVLYLDSTNVVRTAKSLIVDGTLAIGGGSTLTKYITGTVAATGASVTAGACANQGTAITTTGAVAGDACYLGLSASPGNGLTYWCVTGTDTCQIVACNASAAGLTSLTGTHRCTVIH